MILWCLFSNMQNSKIFSHFKYFLVPIFEHAKLENIFELETFENL